MRTRVFAVLALLGLAALGGVDARRRVMPWMCLERCNSTTPEVAQHLKQILEHRHVIDSVSFELFNLGPNGTLVRNNLSDVAPALQAAGFETIPMISSYPYPPEFLDWMRAMFTSPIGDKFIEEAVAATVAGKFTGLNVDWEPTTTATATDAANYAAYLDKFARKMHEHGKILTVDTAEWSALWNLTEIGASAVDRVMTMSTYTNNFTSFDTHLHRSVAAIPLHKLGIGLATLNLDNDKPFSKQEIKERFDEVEKADVREVDLWVAPIPDEFWPFLEEFVNRP